MIIDRLGRRGQRFSESPIASARQPAPEVAANINTTEMGGLGLTPEEEGLTVLFLKTLTDR